MLWKTEREGKKIILYHTLGVAVSPSLCEGESGADHQVF